MYAKHAELKAGVIVLAGLVALLALLFFAGGAELFWKDHRYVHIRFEQGFVAPREGDAVTMNGVVVGRVADVVQREEVRRDEELTAADRRRLGLAPGESGVAREVYVVAVVEMPQGQIVPEGTVALIEEDITGARDLALKPGLKANNLTDAETRENPIPGRQKPGLSELSQRLDSLIDKVESFVSVGTDVIGEARALLEAVRTKVEAIDAAALNEEATQAVASLRRTLEGLERRMQTISDNVERASGDAAAMASEGREAVVEVRADVADLLAALHGVAERIDRLIERQEPKIDRTFDAVLAAAAEIERGARKIGGLADQFSGIGPEARAILAGLGEDADLFMERLNDTARNLVDASEDIRAHPWKLLNEPTPQQIAFENLKAVMLNWTRAVADVDEASRRLKKLLARDDAENAEVRERIERAVRDFEATMERYKQIERRLLQMLQSAPQGADGAPRPGR